MPSDKKLVAAADHTAQQAELAQLAVDNAHRKVERAREHVEAAEEALQALEERYEKVQAEADEAKEAAKGVDRGRL